MRRESAQQAVEIGFDGYGIGGLSVGETRAEMLPALAAALEHLPTDRPRYLMGVGDPASLVEAVALGVDQFDCVMQTRLGRHGTALTSTGRFQAKAARNAELDEPLDRDCPCEVCARHSRGYIRHLLQVGEPIGIAPALHPQRGLDHRPDGPDAYGDRRRHLRSAATFRPGCVELTGAPTEWQLGSPADMTAQLSTIIAQESGGGGGGALIQLGILLLIPFAMYFFMIRPQRRRVREQQDLQRSIQVGDEVITTSGIFGTITGEDGDTRFWLEVDDDVQIRIARAAIQGKASPDSQPAVADVADAGELESANPADDD